MTDVNWGALASITMVVSAVGAVVLVVLRSKLSHYFVTRQEHIDMDQRLQAAEQKLATAPNHADLRTILDRLAQGQGKFDVMAARMDGIGNMVGRVENQVDMLVRAQLEREGRGQV